MRQRTRLILNAVVNLGARAVTVGTRFLIIPFAIGVMGEGYYGIWIVVGPLLAYTRVFEMGLRSAVGREVALRLARGEGEVVNRHVNTAAAYYLVVGGVIAALTVLVSVFFVDWFHVEPAYHTSARVMVLCAGLAIALSIPQDAYGAVLAGLQRYEIISGTQIGADLLRLALIFALLQYVGIGGGLILLAVASGGTTLGAAVLRTFAAVRLCPHVTLRPWQGDRALLWPMVAFGVNTVLYMMSAMMAAQFAQILIGSVMSTARATQFAQAVMLVMTVHIAAVACTVGIKAAASNYDGQGSAGMLRHLLVRSTRYVSVVTLMGLMVLFVFPETFLRLWQGDNYPGLDGAATIARMARTCRILAVGFAFFWAVLPAYNVVNGMGRHKLPGILAMAASATSMALVAILASTAGATIDRVAWGVVLPMLPVWGGIMGWYCCRQTDQPIGSYVWSGFAIPALGCLPAAMIGLMLNHYYPASTLWTLAGQLACCALVLLPCAWFAVLAADDRSHLIALMLGVVGRRHSEE